MKYALAQLRHAYAQLVATTVVDQRSFAEGLIAPAIVVLEKHDRRVEDLLTYNNEQVEKRRAATALLEEAGKLFRFYEASHRAKVQPHYNNPVQASINLDATTKAKRNAEIAGRIEALLKDILG